MSSLIIAVSSTCYKLASYPIDVQLCTLYMLYKWRTRKIMLLINSFTRNQLIRIFSPIDYVNSSFHVFLCYVTSIIAIYLGNLYSAPVHIQICHTVYYIFQMQYILRVLSNVNNFLPSLFPSLLLCLIVCNKFYNVLLSAILVSFLLLNLFIQLTYLIGLRIIFANFLFNFNFLFHSIFIQI